MILNLLPKRVISGRGDSDPYMIRYTVLNLWIAGVYIHQILRSDDCPDSHDHPWPFFHLILSGGYWESYPHLDNGPPTHDTIKWRHPGYWAFRSANYLHQVLVASGRPSWSLVITGPRVRTWGFLETTTLQWIEWKTYLIRTDTTSSPESPK